MVLLMADDDDGYVEGDAGSEPADAPGTVPADDAPARPKSNEGGFDSSVATEGSKIQTTAQMRAQRQAQGRKLFAEAMLAGKKEAAKPAAAKPASEPDVLDPEAPIPPAAQQQIAAAKAAAAPAAEVPPAVAPPAPGLDPEVRQLRESLKADRAKLDAERAEWEKQRHAEAAKPAEQTPDALSLERYLDSSAGAFRAWLEAMRGEKLTDEDFKSEASDFVTQLSGDVLGVPLPDAMRTALEAKLARKSVKTFKTIQEKRSAEAAKRAEAERAAAEEKAANEHMEAEWGKAAGALSQQFAPQPDATGTPQVSAAAKAYPWLAIREEPGKHIVDVIRSQLKADGTQLTWQEASKRANDFLADSAKQFVEKHRALLAPLLAPPAKPAPAAAPAAKPAAPIAAVPAVPAQPAATPAAPRKYSREREREQVKAAFRAKLAEG